MTPAEIRALAEFTLRDVAGAVAFHAANPDDPNCEACCTRDEREPILARAALDGLRYREALDEQIAWHDEQATTNEDVASRHDHDAAMNGSHGASVYGSRYRAMAAVHVTAAERIRARLAAEVDRG